MLLAAPELSFLGTLIVSKDFEPLGIDWLMFSVSGLFMVSSDTMKA